MAFNLDNYEQVKERIARFYHDHKDGRILTELVTIPSELDKHAAFKSLIYLGEILTSTGYAYEAKGQTGVNKDSWVENCETSAIGRALANLDYCGSMRPSREEMRKTEEGRNADDLIDTQDWEYSLANSDTMETLQAQFKEAWIFCKGNAAAQLRITTVKDKRKRELS